MDVGGPVVDGVEHHLLNEPDDRRVIDFEAGRLLGLVLRLLVGELEVDVLAGETLQGLLGRFGQLGDQRASLFSSTMTGSTARPV
jgi:hypothetical protein